MNIPTKDPGIKPMTKYLITTHLICLKKKAKREQLLINWKAACNGTMQLVSTAAVRTARKISPPAMPNMPEITEVIRAIEVKMINVIKDICNAVYK